MSVIFPHAILGPELAASILWAPGTFQFFLRENPHAHKILCFWGGGLRFLAREGWKCQSYFHGHRDFLALTKSVWDFQVYSQTFPSCDLKIALGNEGKGTRT